MNKLVLFVLLCVPIADCCPEPMWVHIYGLLDCFSGPVESAGRGDYSPMAKCVPYDWDDDFDVDLFDFAEFQNWVE